VLIVVKVVGVSVVMLGGVKFKHNDWFVFGILTVGNACIVTVSVLIQPFVFLYEITDVPALIPVISPVLLIVATPVDADDHGVVASAVAEPVNCVVLLTQALNVPVIVGSGLIVITAEPVLSPLAAVQFASDNEVTVYVLVVAKETENV